MQVAITLNLATASTKRADARSPFVAQYLISCGIEGTNKKSGTIESSCATQPPNARDTCVIFKVSCYLPIYTRFNVLEKKVKAQIIGANEGHRSERRSFYGSSLIMLG